MHVMKQGWALCIDSLSNRHMIIKWRHRVAFVFVLLIVQAKASPTFTRIGYASLAYLRVRGGSSDSPLHEEMLLVENERKRKRKRQRKESHTPVEVVDVNYDKANVTKTIESQGTAITPDSMNMTLSEGVANPIVENEKIKNDNLTTEAKPKSIKTKGSNPSKKVKRRKTPSRPPKAGKEGECLRRIKREWKDAVKLGIAYDWKTSETVTIKGRSANGRIHSESEENNASEDDFYKYNYIRMGPYGSNLLRWHFSVMGPAHSCFAGGVYHGRILLPKDYPMSPPRVQILTPSGRFHPGEDICLSASAFHPETWTPR